MKRIRRTSTLFSRRHQHLDYYREQREPAEKKLVRLLVDHSIARYLVNSRLQYGFQSETVRKDGVEMTFETPWLEDGFARWYLMFADYANILEPELLKVRVAELLERQQLRLQGKSLKGAQ
jgi:predicted DNA-binding transcriptional regulator YafY